MIIGNLWGLLALLAIPAIIGIHLFRRRFRPRPISGLFLYGHQPQVPASGRTFSRLRRTMSLLAELFAVLAMTWYLCDPHFADREQARHLVLVLDARMRLRAMDADGSTAEVRARAAAGEAIAALSRDDRVTVITSGAPPRLLAGPGARPSAALAAITAWQADRVWHELDDAVALALELGGATASTVVVSDRLLTGIPGSLGVIAVGKPSPTSGLADARWLRDSQGERLAVRVLALGGGGERKLALLDERGAVLHQQSVTLRPGEPQALVIPAPAGLADGASLGLRLLGDDPFPVDDAVTVLRPASRSVRVRIAVAEPSLTPVRKAIASCAEAVVVEGEQAAHLHIVDAEAEPPQGAWQVRLTSGSAQPVLGPFLARSGDPVLADLDCTGVLWSGGGNVPRDHEALLLAGDTVLLGGTRRNRDRLLTISCDLSRSTLTRHSAWPVLWNDIISARSAALPGPRDPNATLGTSLRFPLPPGQTEAVLEDPAGGRAVLRIDLEGQVLIPGLERSGIHRLLLRDATGEQPWMALNGLALDPRLADLRDAATTRREPGEAKRSTVERERGPLAHVLPLVLAALCALMAWFSFPREERL